MTRRQWLYHRAWVLGLALALTLTLVEPMAAQVLRLRQAKTQDDLAARFFALAQQKVQFEADLQTAKTIDGTLSPNDISALLAPSDRPLMTQRLESVAASARLFNTTYLLSATQPWTGTGPFTGIDGIAQSALTLEADAPNDADIIGFLSHLNALEGRLALQQLTIKPIVHNDAAPLSALNLHMTARFLWLTNAPAEGAAP
ncbi:MAG: hypothetical protein WC612_02520 [Bdellovibrionales bacterium]|jgi:hypothetical protein